MIWGALDGRDARFIKLAAEAQKCSLCPHMTGKTAVLSELNGSLNPRVLFVAEAPGRQGADRTRIPMTGDASGRTFHQLLALTGLTPDEIFITNSVLCSPRTSTGANRRPLISEVWSCSDFLKRTIQLLDPPIVATLGSLALEALGR